MGKRNFYQGLVIIILMSTSLHAQSPDSSKVVLSKKWFRITVAPATLIIAGISTFDKDFIINRYSVRNERNQDIPKFRTHVDDFLQYTPLIAVSALNMMGIKGENEWRNRTALLIKSELLMATIVCTLKRVSHQIRPDSSNFRSFPSGHTAQAFVAATFLHKEFGSKSVWYSIGGYTMATSVGVLRMMNNKHWISDVLVGAGIGILSTNLIYYTHQYRWGKRRALTVLPTYGNSLGIYLAYKFD